MPACAVRVKKTSNLPGLKPAGYRERATKWPVIAFAVCLACLVSARAQGESADLLDSPDAALVPDRVWRVEVGLPAHRWALIRGFYRGSSTPHIPHFAWARQDCAVELFVSDHRPRELAVKVRAAANGTVVSATLNGIPLGGKRVDSRWRVSVWQVPHDALREGFNVVNFHASGTVKKTGGRRQQSVCFQWVALQARECDLGDESLALQRQTVATGRPQLLPPGGMWVVPLIAPPAARIRCFIEGVPGSAVDLLFRSADREFHTGHAQIPASGRTLYSFPMQIPTGTAGRLILVGRGPGQAVIRTLRVTGDESPVGLRAACGLFKREGLAAALLVAVFCLVMRFQWPLPLKRWAPWVDLVAILALAAAVRYLFFDAYPSVGIHRTGDAWEYVRRARTLQAGVAGALSDAGWHAWQTWIRPPGYYFFLAQVFRNLGGGLRTVAVLQLSLSSLTAGAVYLMAYWLFGRGAAVFAGLSYALYIETLFRATLIESESLFLFLLACALACLARVCARLSSSHAVLSGVLLALAILVRSAPLYFAPLAAAALVAAYGWRRAYRPALALLAGVAVLVLPWCARNLAVYGKFAVDDIAVPNVMFAYPEKGLLPLDDPDPATNHARRRYYHELKNLNHSAPESRNQPHVRRALWRMVTHPSYTLRHFARSVRTYLATHDEGFARWIGEERPCRIALITDLQNAEYLILLFLGFLGMAGRLRDRRSYPFMIWFFFILLTVNLLFFRADVVRYRLPTLPVLMVFAGDAFVKVLAYRRRPTLLSP